MSRTQFKEILDEHLALAAKLDLPRIQKRLDAAIDLVVTALAANLPVLVCGNGGSSSDAHHVAAELVGRFQMNRRALNVQCLSANTSVLTAWGNDFTFDSIFARQVEAHGAPGGILWGLSTSGRSKNVVLAARAAKTAKMSVISMTGAGGADLAPLSDVLIDAPTTNTARVQEFHLLFYHFLCQEIEVRLSQA